MVNNPCAKVPFTIKQRNESCQTLKHRNPRQLLCEKYDQNQNQQDTDGTLEVKRIIDDEVTVLVTVNQLLVSLQPPDVLFELFILY